MGGIVRTVTSMKDQVKGKFPAQYKLTFDETPCTYGQACAHLTLFHPTGFVVLARARGPNGGWGRLYCTSEECPVMRYKRFTLHIAYLVKE